jgi:two-component system OmpR family sensor kinase
MRSLRRTLAVRFALTMLAALTLIAVWAFVGVRRTLYRELDRAIKSAAELEAAALAAGRPLPVHPGRQELQAFVREVNRFAVQRAAGGAVTGANTPLARELPNDSAAFASALSGRPTWATLRWGAGRLRAVFLPAPRGSPPAAAVIQVAAALTPLDRASQSVLLRMLVTALAGSLITLVGAWWLAGSVTRLVGEIAAQAQAIQPRAGRQQIADRGDFSEFKGLVGVLNDMVGRLGRALAQQRQMVADVGHELRTPVTAMVGQIEVGLRSPRSPDAYRAILTSTLEEAQRLAALVETVLLLARLDAGEPGLHLTPVDLAAQAEAAIARARARGAGLSLELALEQDGTEVLTADARMLDLLLDQLVDNLLRHTPPGTAARLRISVAPGGIALVLDDAGPGVSPELLSRIFDRFVRGDAARGRGAGAGLGLTAAAAIVAAHRGAISAEPSPMGGLRIAITLPRDAA